MNAANAPAISSAIEFERLPRTSRLQPILPAPLPLEEEELLFTAAPPVDFGVVVEEPLEVPPVDDDVVRVADVLGLPPVRGIVELDELLDPPLWVDCTVEPVVALAPPVAACPPVALDATVVAVVVLAVPPVALDATVVAVVVLVVPPVALWNVVPTAEVPPFDDTLVAPAAVRPPVPVLPAPPAPASASPPEVSRRE